MSVWVTCPKSNRAARLRLFCLPYAGGGASLYYAWASRMPPQVELCPIQLPGRENRLSEPAFATLPPLITQLASNLCPYLDRPYAFFGHSMGALIAFELARWLRGASAPEPAWLFVSGYFAPQAPYPLPLLRHLPDAAFLTELNRLSGIRLPFLDHAELAQMMLPTLRADFELCETYAYRAGWPLACPISAFGGTDDVAVSVGELQAWQVQTQGAFSLHLLPGDHFFPLTARVLLLEALCGDLSFLLRNQDAAL